MHGVVAFPWGSGNTAGVCHSCPNSSWGPFPSHCPDWPFITIEMTWPWQRLFHSSHSLAVSPGSHSTSGHQCVVIMYRGPAWPQCGVGGLFCPVVLLPQCSYLVYLRGHALEQELSPTSLYSVLALFPICPFSVFSGFSCFVSPATCALATLLQPLSGQGVSPLSYRG